MERLSIEQNGGQNPFTDVKKIGINRFEEKRETRLKIWTSDNFYEKSALSLSLSPCRVISAASVSLHVNIPSKPRFPFFPLLFSPLLLRSLSYRCGVKTTYLKSALPGEKMRPSFNSRGMPSSFVTSPDVSLRREKCIPAKIMKPLFHFFSLHFISPPPTAAPSHFEIRTSLHHIPGGASQRAVFARTTIHHRVYPVFESVERRGRDRWCIYSNI